MRERIDWQTIAARLYAAEAALGHGEPTEAQREEIFARRAEALAVPPPPEAPEDAVEALVFSLGTERYAFISEQVREVRAMDQVTLLPSAPAFVAGLINVRGRVVPVLDLRPLFGLASDIPAEAIILLSGVDGAVGVLATDRPDVRRLQASDLGALPPGTPPGLDPACVRGVTPDFVVVLDAARLLAEPSLRVDDDL